MSTKHKRSGGYIHISILYVFLCYYYQSSVLLCMCMDELQQHNFYCSEFNTLDFFRLKLSCCCVFFLILQNLWLTSKFGDNTQANNKVDLREREREKKSTLQFITNCMRWITFIDTLLKLMRIYSNIDGH